MGKLITFTILVCFCFFNLDFTKSYDDDYDDEIYDDDNITAAKGINECESEPKYGIEWLLSICDHDYGWGAETHRGIITVFMALHENQTSTIHVSNWKKELMKAELYFQLSSFLMKNEESLQKQTSEQLQGELSLYIHALLVVGKNPRNFNGVDLVSLLEGMVNRSQHHPHPFSALCLCNVGVLTENLSNNIGTNLFPNTPDITYKVLDRKALMLAAYTCKKNHLGPESFIRDDYLNASVHSLLSYRTKTGSFGNIYTTSVIVHALKAMNYKGTNLREAENYLINESKHLRHVTAIYYVERALRNTAFIRDMSSATIEKGLSSTKPGSLINVMYSIRKEDIPLRNTLTLSIPKKSTMFDMMKIAARENPKFNFLYRMQNDDPVIYSIDGIPNNAEEGKYWMLREENSVRPYPNIIPLDKTPVANSFHYVYEYSNIL